MPKNSVSYLIVLLKGMAMGAADVVPGVSGGTIAFISGIYQELIETIDRLDFGIIKVWKKQGFTSMIEAYNLKFLASLFVGIFISILSLAKVISHLLETYPILVWSFFFGLVIASIFYIGKQITKWSFLVILFMVTGAIIAYYITIVAPSEAPDTWWFFLLSGSIAIIAMILPGISGSFILVLLGSYGLVLNTLTDTIEGLLKQDWTAFKAGIGRVLLFIFGCLIGLKLFSKILKWMFEHKKQITLAVLTGFMVGSLNKIWPWKITTLTMVDRHGEEKIVSADNLLPTQYDGDPQTLMAIVCAIMGFGLILLLERVARQKETYAD